MKSGGQSRTVTAQEFLQSSGTWRREIHVVQGLGDEGMGQEDCSSRHQCPISKFKIITH